MRPLKPLTKPLELGANYYRQGFRLRAFVSADLVPKLVLGELYSDSKYKRLVKLIDYKLTASKEVLVVYQLMDSRTINSKHVNDFIERFSLTKSTNESTSVSIQPKAPKAVLKPKVETVSIQYSNVVYVDFKAKKVIR